MEGQTDEWTRAEKIHRMEGRRVGNIRKERNGQMELEERVSPRGLRGQKPDSQSVDECRGYTLVVFLSFFPPIFFSLLLFLLQLPSWQTPPWAPFLLYFFLSLSSLSYPSTISRLTGRLRPWWTIPFLSPTTFSLSPRSEIVQHQSLRASAGLFHCLWGPIAVFTHPSDDPRTGCALLVQTAADHTALPAQNLHRGRGTATGQHLTTFLLLAFLVFSDRDEQK